MADADLVERDRELQSLGTLVARAAAGEGRLALIEGPAGIGKSRLLAEARRQAADAGMLVLAARAGELEREFPFGAVRQLLEGELADEARRARLLSGAAAGAAAVFGDVAQQPAGPEPEDASFAALHGLFWLVLNLAAERPVLLAVDDLHWCDRPSLRFIAYLARRLEDVPVLLAASWRTTDPGTDPVLLSELAQDPDVAAVRPGPLTEAAVAEVVRAALGPAAEAAFCAACHGATGGNPLLLRQLLRAL
ncbi:MAG: ATP-binding protein, partial [Solirubrobacterales bacterium]|nr:ATP-binding protein [Solirubrobacterales bacterium]